MTGRLLELTVSDLAVIERVRLSLEPDGALPFWDLLRQKAQLLPS